MIEVGKQCHDSCSTSAATRVRRATANKRRQFKRGALATPLGQSVGQSVSLSTESTDRQTDRIRFLLRSVQV